MGETDGEVRGSRRSARLTASPWGPRWLNELADGEVEWSVVVGEAVGEAEGSDVVCDTVGAAVGSVVVGETVGEPAGRAVVGEADGEVVGSEAPWRGPGPGRRWSPGWRRRSQSGPQSDRQTECRAASGPGRRAARTDDARGSHRCGLREMRGEKGEGNGGASACRNSVRTGSNSP